MRLFCPLFASLGALPMQFDQLNRHLIYAKLAICKM